MSDLDPDIEILRSLADIAEQLQIDFLKKIGASAVADQAQLTELGTEITASYDRIIRAFEPVLASLIELPVEVVNESSEGGPETEQSDAEHPDFEPADDETESTPLPRQSSGGISLEQYILNFTAGRKGSVSLREIAESLQVSQLDKELNAALFEAARTLTASGQLVQRLGRAAYRNATVPITTPSKPVKVRSQPKPSAPETVQPPTTLETVVSEYAVQKGPFRMEELRSDIPAVKSLSADDYKLFKSDFEKFKAGIIAELQQRGVRASWAQTGQARGRRYQLTVHGTVEQGPSDVPANTNVEPSLIAARQPRRALPSAREYLDGQLTARSTMTFEASVRRTLRAAMGEANTTVMPQAVIVQQLASAMGLPENEALELTRGLVPRGLLHNTPSKGGRKQLSLEPVEAATDKGGAANNRQAGETSTAKSLSASDVNIAVQVYNILSRTGTNQGANYSVVAKEVASTHGITVTQARAAIQRLRGTGSVTILPTTRRRRSALLSFPSTQAKTQWGKDPDSTVQILRGFIAEQS